jgi:transcriptional regulator with XRE-family HTH domain
MCYLPTSLAPEGRSSSAGAAEDLSAAGYTVTSGYLRQLRSGKRRNPTARLLAGIAKLFEVPITYFFDDAGRAE